MTPTDRGVFLQIMAVLAMAWGYATLGTDTPILGVARGSVEAARRAIRNTRGLLVVALAIAVPVSTGATAAVAGSQVSAALLVVAGAIVISATISVRQATLLRVQERFGALAIAIPTPTVVALVGQLALAARSELTVTGALASYLLGSIVLNAFLAASDRRRVMIGRDVLHDGVEPSSAAEEGWQHLLRSGLKDLVTTMPTGILVPVQLLLIGSLMSPSAASLYSVARTVTSPLQLITATLTNVFLPKFASRQRNSRGHLLRRSLVVSMGAAVVLGTVVVVVAYFVIPWLYGAEYASAVPLTAVLAFAGVFGVGTGVCTLAFRVSLRYREVIVTSYVILGLNVLAGFVFLPTSGLGPFVVASALLGVVQFMIIARFALRASDTGGGEPRTDQLGERQPDASSTRVKPD